MFTRTLGRSGIVVSALGLGCWTIGGAAWRGERANGWSGVDDADSIRAIHRALDLGLTFFDTADVYGAGHSETVLGQALAGQWDKVVIATKFGNCFVPATKQIGGEDASPDYIRRACEASLKRLGAPRIDLYQLHLPALEWEAAIAARETLEELVQQGKIRYYGWSTDDPERARLFAQGPHCTAIQQRLNIFEGEPKVLDVCDEFNLASINRTPLSKGLLTGRFDADTTFPKDDVRYGWNLKEGRRAEWLAKLDQIKAILTTGGRTLAQGALAWIWGRNPHTIPIPGFRNAQQIEENAAAMSFGPLTPAQMREIAGILGR